MRRMRRGVTALRAGSPPTDLLDPATWLRTALQLASQILGPARRPTPAAGAARTADPQRERDARAALDKLATTGWETAIRYGVATTTPTGDGRPGAGLDRLADAVAAAFGG